MYIIGVDIGTTNTKAVAFTDGGQVLADASSSYPVYSTTAGAHELDPEQLFQAVRTVITNVLTRTAGQPGPGGISFSCAMHSLIVVGRDGRPLTRAITWADQRSKDFAEKLKHSEAGARIYKHTGTAIHPMSPLCKLLWLKDQQPELFSQAGTFISIKEYIWWRFFDVYEIDHSIASATGLFDIRAFTWYRESLALAGIREDQLSQLVPCTHSRSYSSDEIQGLAQGTPFIIGGSDGAMANLGSRAVAPGETALTIGTSGAIRMTTGMPDHDPAQRIFQYALTKELYICGGATNNGGAALEWYVRNFGGGRTIDQLVPAAHAIAPGSDGLIFLPYLLGERAPIWNADASAVFFGIRSIHTQGHFLRSVLEGICFSLYQVGASLEETIGPIKHIYASGGWTRSADWLQMMADVFGKEVYTTSSADASAIGACIMGFYALGGITDPAAGSALIQVKDKFAPHAERHHIYQKNFTLYGKLYQRLHDLM